MGDPAPQKVTLHLYDLSQGMARAMSAQLLGKQLDGIWHTGIVCFGQGRRRLTHNTYVFARLEAQLR